MIDIEQLQRAAQQIANADALLIGAGAGMGVDSGLPDFRGDEGFWKAYPPFHGRRFAEMSNPEWFHSDPEQAWGFFGHRSNLYTRTRPHAGFDILKRWAEALPVGYFVFTSNVDGHFQRAGFDAERVIECHGSIRYLQCRDNCTRDIWPAGDLQVDVDEDTIRARPPLPRCRHCDAPARPNILMFFDGEWNHRRAEAQQARYQRWLASLRGKRLAVIEMGAGLGVPTVRYECERHAKELIRINPREPAVPGNGISVATGALQALRAIDRQIGRELKE